MICEICGKELSKLGLPRHIATHKISTKDYYDKYIKYDKLEGICPTCSKPTKFLGISSGYRHHCSVTCSSIDPNVFNTFRDKNPQKDEIIKEQTKQTCLTKYGTEYAIASKEVKDKISQVQKSKHIEYDNLVYIEEVINKYGNGWYQKRKLLNIEPVKVGRYNYIKKLDIYKIEDYQHSLLRHSTAEFLVAKELTKHNIIYKQNTRKVLDNKFELDFYFPDHNIGVEINSNYYHCYQKNKNKNYHLNKSLYCRSKNIRLIHIYEFENLNKQIKLLISLLNGIDLFPQNDFNKNNLIDNIPSPTIIYDSTNYTIYGAGPLIKGDEL